MGRDARGNIRTGRSPEPHADQRQLSHTWGSQDKQHQNIYYVHRVVQDRNVYDVLRG